ncbi:ABC transporter ATP-binding protein [Paenibacillus sp. sgz302251]|uniref:ABC transporter ATP-binding protein n=1 Tax=Paenibacillus sp. sgz302251 TaxID=3414493 RepID=UPI003C7B32C3
MKSKRLLVDFFKETWHIYFFSILFHLIANIIHVQFPRVLRDFTDELQAGHLTQEAVVNYSWLLLGIGAGFALIGGLAQYLVMYVGRLFEFLTRRKLFNHFTGLSESFYSKNGVGKLLSYFMNDVTAVRESISMGVNQTAGATILLISVITMLVLSDIPYDLIIACMLPLILIPFIVVKLGPVIRKRSLKVQESLAQMTESAEEQFGGIRVTKKFAVEPIMNRRFGETVDRIRDNQLNLVRVSSFFQALIPFLGALSLIIALALGGYLTIAKEITLGGFVALTLYIRMLMNPLQQIGNVINTMQRSRASLERLNDLLSKQPDIKQFKDALSLDFQHAGIHIHHLSFSYEESSKEALRNINLDIKPGTMLGIVGRTGSGKTTLMKLLLRTYDPPAGTIWFNETDIRDLTLESLRRQIAYVPQDGFLFSTTIRENIAFYRREALLEEVEDAAQKAQIYSNIIDFPDRFDTKLGERGVTLSGGQRQRTSLARGIIKNSPIMILDDSVSAVDAVTETDIMESIRASRIGKTTILIANRISALKHADEIIVMDEGEIVQRGTHEKLLAQEGLYATLHAIQEEGSHHAAGH